MNFESICPSIPFILLCIKSFRKVQFKMNAMVLLKMEKSVREINEKILKAEDARSRANICEFFSPSCSVGRWSLELEVGAGGVRLDVRTLNVHKISMFFGRKLGFWVRSAVLVCVRGRAGSIGARAAVCVAPPRGLSPTYRALRPRRAARYRLSLVHTLTHTCMQHYNLTLI